MILIQKLDQTASQSDREGITDYDDAECYYDP
jgi:hypothetical protein